MFSKLVGCLRINCVVIAMLVALVACTAVNASAAVTTPIIRAASFDGRGRLLVRAAHSGYAGCYVTVNGGLSSNHINTAIISRTITANEAHSGRVQILTKHKYYCAKRTLYVNVEMVCLGNDVAQVTSDSKRVAVPSANFRR